MSQQIFRAIYYKLKLSQTKITQITVRTITQLDITEALKSCLKISMLSITDHLHLSLLYRTKKFLPLRWKEHTAGMQNP